MGTGVADLIERFANRRRTSAPALSAECNHFGAVSSEHMATTMRTSSTGRSPSTLILNPWFAPSPCRRRNSTRPTAVAPTARLRRRIQRSPLLCASLDGMLPASRLPPHAAPPRCEACRRRDARRRRRATRSHTRPRQHPRHSPPRYPPRPSPRSLLRHLRPSYPHSHLPSQPPSQVHSLPPHTCGLLAN
eukprot:5045889-Pleurochrysis_carterae.AAC.3